MLQRGQYKVAKEKAHRLATKECELGETAGRVKEQHKSLIESQLSLSK